MLKRYSAISALLLLMCGNALHAQSPDFTVNFTWQGTASCFDPKSPPFSLSGVPGGTKVLRFSMKDLDAPNYPHGGGSVDQGPCPPQGQHSYRWTVEAQDGTGKTLAVATVTRKFPER